MGTYNKEKYYYFMLKSNFFDKIFKLFSSSVLPPNVNFANLLIYFESLENPQTFEEDPQLKKKLDDQPTPPDSAIELLKQISDSYNDLFADITPKTRFIDDAFCSNGVLSTTAFLYKVKDELTKALLNLLLIDKDKASKRFPHSGILYDDGVPILNAEVEGHIGIVSVHIPLFLQNEPGMKEALASLKNYSSAIKKLHILVPATQEQKKQLKAAVSNVASLNNPEKRAILTQYLGMATGNYYEFYKAMNNDKTK